MTTDPKDRHATHKNFVTDVIRFCEWMQPYLLEARKPMVIADLMNDDDITMSLRMEMCRVNAENYKRLAREDYNKRAVHVIV